MNNEILLIYNIIPILFNFIDCFIFVTDLSYDILLKNKKSENAYKDIKNLKEIKSFNLESIVDYKSNSYIYLKSSTLVHLQYIKINNYYLFILHSDIDNNLSNHDKCYLKKVFSNIKSPLNNIINTLSFLEETKLSTNQEKYINHIKDSSLNIISVINDITDITNITKNNIQLHITQNNINNFINSLNDIVHSKLLDKNNLQYNYIIDNHVPKIINFDKERLLQIIINLIDNAIYFTNDGNISLYIYETDYESYLNFCNKYKFTPLLNKTNVFYIRFNISDTGCGIPEDIYLNIFELFFKYSNKTNKNGLGLFICKELIKLMNGVIWLDSSELNKGSCFSFILPLFSNLLKKNGNENSNENKISNEKNTFNVLLYKLNNNDINFFLNNFSNSNINFIICNNNYDLLNIVKNNKILLGYINPIEFSNLNLCLKFPLIGIGTSNQVFDFIIDSINYPLCTQKIHETIKHYIPYSNKIKKQTLSILIIDNIHLNQVTLSKCLRNLGCENINILNDFTECKNIIIENNIDIIFLNLNQYTDNKINIIDFIKKKNLHIYICLITTELSDSSKIKLINNGFNDFLIKPIDSNKLKSILNKFYIYN